MKEKLLKDPASIQVRIKRNTAIMMFKCLNGLAPDYLADRFTCLAKVRQKNTRSAAAKKAFVKNTRGKASPSFRRRGTKISKDLPGSIPSKNSILHLNTSFIVKITIHTLSSYTILISYCNTFVGSFCFFFCLFVLATFAF